MIQVLYLAFAQSWQKLAKTLHPPFAARVHSLLWPPLARNGRNRM